MEKQLAELRSALASGANGNALTQAEAQLRGLSQLQRRIANADANGLIAVRAEVTASVAATQALLQQTQLGVSSVQSAQAALTAASEAAERTTTSFMQDYYDRRIFDPYLKFASTKDEEEYRRREDERRAAIEKAQAEHTPQGDLRALNLSIEQMKDAGAHGATSSSQFQPILKGIEGAKDRLATQIDASKSAALQKERNDAVTAPTQQASLDGAITPDVIASLRAAQVAVADQAQEGHGLTGRSVAASNARTP
jgi:hypothetical protein